MRHRDMVRICLTWKFLCPKVAGFVRFCFNICQAGGVRHHFSSDYASTKFGMQAAWAHGVPLAKINHQRVKKEQRRRRDCHETSETRKGRRRRQREGKINMRVSAFGCDSISQRVTRRSTKLISQQHIVPEDLKYRRSSSFPLFLYLFRLFLRHPMIRVWRWSFRDRRMQERRLLQEIKKSQRRNIRALSGTGKDVRNTNTFFFFFKSLWIYGGRFFECREMFSRAEDENYLRNTESVVSGMKTSSKVRRSYTVVSSFARGNEDRVQIFWQVVLYFLTHTYTHIILPIELPRVHGYLDASE